MKYVHIFLDGLGTLFDKIAGVPSGQLQSEIGFLVTVLAGTGVLHVANANTFAASLYALVVAILAVGVAIKQIVGAYATAKFAPPTK